MCKAKLPDRFVNRLSEREDDPWQFEVGVEYAAGASARIDGRWCPWRSLLCLNKSQATNRILDGLAGFASRRGAA